MTRLVTARLAQLVLLLLLVSFLSYLLIGLMPGDPIDLMIQSDPRMTSADVARLKALAGIDRPILERWLDWLVRLCSGEMGYSRLYALPVAEVIWPRLWSTLVLSGTSLVLATALALWLGTTAALRPGSLLDRVINLAGLAMFSFPPFWLALLSILVFAVLLRLLPAGGEPPNGAGPLSGLRWLVLPIGTLTLATAGPLIRYVRSTVGEALAQPFIQTARAKGLSTRQVVLRHALPFAAPALLNVLALQLGSVLSGALVVETIFARLGMGKLLYDAVLGNDYNLALVALLVATAATLLANLAADILHAKLDPRVRLEA